jgi:hypothetical protein
MTRSAYGYADGNPLNGSDPLGLCTHHGGLGGFIRDGACAAGDVVTHPRLPDYVSIDIPVTFPLATIGLVPVGVGPDLNITVNRDGKVYVGPGAGGGLAGFSPSIRGGWLNQTSPPCSSKVDRFSSGWSATAGGTIPLVGPFGPSFGETEGFPGSATEFGIGSGASAGAAGNHSLKLPWQLPGW